MIIMLILQYMSNFSSQKIHLQSQNPKLDFQLLLTLQDETIDMKLTCQQQMLFFGLQVDKQYIQNNNDMMMLFPSVRCLYSTMEKLEEEFEVFTDGKIVINIDLSAAKIDIKKQYTFQLKKSPLAELQWLKMKLKQQRKYRQQQQRKSQNKMTEIQSIIAQKQSKIQQYHQQMKKIQVQLGKTANKMLVFQQEIERLQLQLQQAKQSNKKHKKYIQQLQQSLADQKQESKSVQTQLTVCQHQRQRIISSICTFNPHSQHFITKYQAQTIQVIKKCENGWSNFVSGWQIPQKQVTTFRFKQVKTRDGSLGIGIGTQAVFSSLNIEHIQYLAYFCRDGRIYENGMKRMNGNPFVAEKDFIVQINRIQGKVDWLSDKIIIGTATIPASLSSKHLYLIVKIFWKQDQFQLYY